jgi:hypothetical protein
MKFQAFRLHDPLVIVLASMLTMPPASIEGVVPHVPTSHSDAAAVGVQLALLVWPWRHWYVLPWKVTIAPVA